MASNHRGRVGFVPRTPPSRRSASATASAPSRENRRERRAKRWRERFGRFGLSSFHSSRIVQGVCDFFRASGEAARAVRGATGSHMVGFGFGRALFVEPLEERVMLAADIWVNNDWALVTDNGTPGVVDAGDIVRNDNDAVNPGTITGTYGTDAFGVVTTGAATGFDAAFDTIQDAVSAVDPAGTVTVLDGAYTEDIVVGVSGITLRSNGGAASTTIQGVSTGFTGAVRIAADDVTLGGLGEGFTIIGTGQAGVYVNAGVDNLLVQDNIIQAANGKNALLTEFGTGETNYDDNEFTGDASQLVYVNGAGAPVATSTYDYTSPTLQPGFGDYVGGVITASVTFDPTDLAALSGAGGTLATGDVDAYSFSVSLPGYTISNANASFAFISATFDSTLQLTDWSMAVEAQIRGSAAPESIITHSHGPLNLAGDNDGVPNDTGFSLGQHGANHVAGTWSVVLSAPAVTANFTNNTFSGSATGPLLGLEGSDGQVTGNQFTGGTPYAQLELWGSGNTVTGNTFDGTGDGAAIVDPLDQYNLADLIADNTFPNGAVTLESGGNVVGVFGSLQDAIDSASSGDIIHLGSGTYSGLAIDIGAGNTVTLDGSAGGVVFEGASPALTVMSGEVVVQNGVTFNQTGADPTILVENGGSLTLIDCVVNESSDTSATAIRVDAGGALDLSSNDNTLNVIGAGNILEWFAAADLDLTGTALQLDGGAFASDFDVEDAIDHALDNVGSGLATWVANNIFVTTNTLGIQRGVDVSSAGDTVQVAAGTYAENIVITTANNGLTLLGAKAGVAAGPDAVPAGRGTGESIIQGLVPVLAAEREGAVRLFGSVTGFTIDGFTIQSQSADGQSAVFLRGSSNIVQNNIMDGATFGPAATGSHPIAAARFPSGVRSANFDSMLIQNNHIQDFRYGMNLDGGTGNQQSTIAENYITGSTTSSIFIQGSVSNGHIIEGNVLENNASGIVVAQGQHLITDNTIRDGASWAISIFATANTFDNIITGNIIENNGAGIRFTAGAQPGIGGHVVSSNSIFGTVGQALHNFHTNWLIDATGNWWGTTDENDIATFVTGAIDFSSVLTGDTDTDIAKGFQGDFSELIVHTLGDAVNPDGRIAQALELVDDGGNLLIRSGTYIGDVDASSTGVNKAVTFSPGASPGQVSITGNMTLDGDDTLDIEIDGLSESGPTEFDNFLVSGTTTLGGAAITVAGSYAPAIGDSFTVIDATTLLGTSSTSSVSLNGIPLDVTYPGGGNVVLTVSPQADVWVDDDWVITVDTDFSGTLTAGDIVESDPDDGDDPVSGLVFGYNAFATVTDAVAAVADLGTVHVLAGTFNESLTIAKDVTIEGQSDADTFIDAGGAFTGILVSSGFSVDISGIELSNFSSTGIHVQGDLALSDSTVSGGFVGIWVDSGLLDMSSSIVAGAQIFGVQISGAGADAQIDASEIGGAASSAAAVVVSGGNADITGSILEDSQRGLLVNASGSASIHDSELSTSILLRGVENATATIVDASGNWWGTASESGVQGETLGLVDFTPYLNFGTDTDGGARGFAGDTSHLHVTALGQQTSGGRVQEAIDLIADGTLTGGARTVDVKAGTYAERLVIDRSLALIGAQANVDPTAFGARANPAVESIIDATGLGTLNPNMMIDIVSGISDVTLRGFTLNNTPTPALSDNAVIRAKGSNDGLAVEDNIISGYQALIYRGGDDLVVDSNRVTVNKNGVVVQSGPATNIAITNNAFSPGANLDADPAAIQMTAVDGGVISGNTATGFTGGRGLGGSNLHNLDITGNTFTDNNDAISIFGGSTFIDISAGNDLSDNARYGINIKGQDIDITGNTLDGNATAAIFIDTHVIPTQDVSIVGNTYLNTSVGIRVANGEVEITEAIDGATTAIHVAGGDVTISGSDLTNASAAGILVGAGGSATIIDNDTSINGNAVGIDVDGGSATISGNHIYDNGTGIRFTNGGTGSVDSNDFEGGADPDNATDLLLTSTAGTITSLTDNTFAGDTFFIDNQGPQNFDVTAGTGNTFDETDNFRIEDKMHHRVDTDLPVTVGRVTWVADTLYVTSPGGGSTDSDIQRGIDAASGGDTIFVEDGTYTNTAQVLVNKDLTIIGEGKTTTVFDKSFNTTTSGDGRGWWLVTPGVTLDLSHVGFDGTGTLTWQAIRHVGDGGTIDNVAFSEIRYQASGSPYNGIGVAFLPAGGGNLDVTNSMFSEIGRIGVIYFGAGVTGTYSGNMYTGKGLGDWLDYAVEVGAGAVVDITGNQISGNLGTAISDGSTSAGVLVTTFFGGGSEAHLSGNTIDNNTTGVFVGFNNADTSVVTIDGDTITNNTNSGVYVIGGTVTIENDTTLTGNGTGITVGDGGEAFILNNDDSISGNTIGIDVDGGAATITNNHIHGNTTGIRVEDGSATISDNNLDLNTTGVEVTGTGTLTVGTGNTISGATTGMVFDGAGVGLTGLTLSDVSIDATGDYITLANGAFDDLEIDATGTTLGGVAVSSMTNAQLLAAQEQITDEIDDNTLGLVVLVANTIFVTPVLAATALDNDYTRIKNAIEAAQAGYTIVLGKNSLNDGVFDWDEPFALASWALGNDGTASTDDDYGVLLPAGLNDVTVTADLAESISIQGPGDVTSFDLEGVFLAFGNGTNTGWTFENFGILDFDNAIGFYFAGDDYSDLTVQNMHIRVAADSSTDSFQNIGIHYARGTNILITGNLIELVGGGDGTTMAIQSNTHGGASYDGLTISDNDIVVLNAGNERIFGIWENGHAHASNITVSGNTFTGAAGNTGEQTAFRITSHSGASTTVTYSGNEVTEADVGFAWLAEFASVPQDYTGTSPVELVNNMIDSVAVGVQIGGINASANITGGNITGASGIGVDIADGNSATISGVTLQNLDIGVRVGGSATISGNFFDNVDDNLIDVQLTSTASAITIDSGNTFGGDDFFIENLSTLDIDLTASGSTFDETNNFRIEDKMHHRVDTDLAVTVGLVTWVADNLFVTDPAINPVSTDSSIQRGIDAAAAGNTINVEAGEYAITSSILVNKSVNILGAQAGEDARTRTSVPESKITNDNSVLNAFNISDDDVTIDGFHIEGFGVGINTGAASIQINGVKALNNIVVDMSIDGINFHKVGSGSGSEIAFNYVEDVPSTLGSGITGGGSSGPGTIHIHHNKLVGVQHGITGYQQESLIEFNEIIGDSALVDGAGIAGQFIDVTLNENQISGYTAGSGIAFVPYPARPISSGIVVTGNEIEDNRIGVLVFQDSTDLLEEFADNTIDDSSVAAIAHAGIGTLDLTDTLWTGNTIDGINIHSTDIADQFQLEDKILHAIDGPGTGLVLLLSNQLFVTPNSYSSLLGTTTPSIQRGVDAVPLLPTWTVNVEDGVYVEQIEIAKDLTLLGESQAGTIIQAPASLALDNSFVYAGTTRQSVVAVTAGDVTIQSLTVDGDGAGGTVVPGNDFHGIGIHNADATIDSVTVTGVRDNPLNGIQRGRAIFAGNDSGTHTVIVTGSDVNDYQKNGIDLRGAGLTANITNNTITGAGDTAIIAQNGIVLLGGVGGTISGNTISGHMYSGPLGGSDPLNDTQAIGILLFDAGDVAIDDSSAANIIDANDVGIYSWGGNITIEGNELGNTTANRYEGIFVDESNTTVSGNDINGGNIGILVLSFAGNSTDSVATITGNTVTSAGVAVHVIDEDNSDASLAIAKLEGNTLVGSGAGANDVGLRVEGGAIVDAGSVVGDGDPTGLGASAGGNILTGYTGTGGNYAIENLNLVGDGDPDVLAKFNDFGPYVDLSIIEYYVFDDTDDATRTMVIFTGALNQQPAANTVFVDDDWAGTALGVDADGAGGGSLGNGTQFGVDQFATIQDAINAVAVGGTILVYAGSYSETVDVFKKVTIDGEGSGDNDTVDTIVEGRITVSASGTSAGDRTTLKDLRVSGSDNHGVSAFGVDFLEFNNVASVGHDLDGFHLSNIDDLVMTDIVASDNGASAPATVGSGIGLNGVRDAVLTNITAENNYSNGIGITARASTTGNTSNIVIDGATINNPASGRPEGTNGINLYVDDANGASSISGVEIKGTVNIEDHAFGGITLFNAGLTSSISGVEIAQNGGDDVNLTNNVVDVVIFGNVSNVDLTADLTAGGNTSGGVSILGLDNVGTLSPTGVVLDGSSFTGYSLATPAISLAAPDAVTPAPFGDLIGASDVSALNTTFDGVTVASGTTRSEFFAIEDLIVHAIDVSGTGLVSYDPDGDLYVTTNSFVLGFNTAASIQRGVDAADPGDTVHVSAGTFSEQVTIGKDVDLLGESGATTLTSTAAGHLITIDGSGFGDDETVSIENINFDGSGGTASTGVFVASTADFATLSVTNGNFTGFNLHGVGVFGNAATGLSVQNVELTDLTFSNNGLGGGGGTGDIQMFEYNGDATFTGLDLVGSATATTGARGGIQFRGVGAGDGTGVLPMGNVTLDDVDVSGTYRTQMIGLQRYSDVSGLSFTDVKLGGAGSEITGTFGASLRFDAVGSGSLATPATFDLGNTEFRGLDGTSAQRHEIEFAPDNSFTFLRVDGTGTTWSGIDAIDLTLPQAFDVEDRILHYVDKLNPTHGVTFGPYKGFVDIQADQAFITDAADAGLVGDGSIQRGVDVVAVDGTVNVSAGTFAEGSQILIDKDVNVIGQGMGVTILNPGFNTGSGGDARGWWLVETGANLNLSELTMDGTGHLVWQAIRHRGTGLIDQVAFENIQFNAFGTTSVNFTGAAHYQGNAIAAFGGGGAVDVTNSTFADIGRVGVLYFGAGTTGTFSDNVYVGKGVDDTLDYALDISAGAVVDVMNNMISDNQGTASSDGSTSAGVLVTTFFGPGTQANLSGNEISSNTTGVFVGFDNTDDSVVMIDGDTITNNTSSGVFIIGGTATIKNDTILTGNGTGIKVSDGGSATIIDNDDSITGNTVGIDVDGGTALVENNDLNGNTIGVLIQNDGIADLGQTGAGIDFTGLGVSAGGNDFSSYTSSSSSTGAIVNLNTSGDYANPGPQGLTGPFYDVTAQNNIFSGTFTTVGDSDNAIWHDTDDSDVGFVDYANLLDLTVSLDTLPTIVTSASIDEGGAVTVSGEFSNVAQQHTVTITWGDGSPDTVIPLAAGVFTFSTASPAATYTDDPDGAIQSVLNTITVTVEETFGSDSADDDSLEVTVSNVVPTVSLVDQDGDNEINEGETFNLVVGPRVDPGDDTISAYTIFWGDGNSTFVSGDPLTSSAVHSHLYTDGVNPPTRTITIDVLDDDGTWTDVGSLVIDVHNVNPTAANFQAFNSTVDEGSTTTVFFSGPFIDPGSSDSPFHFAYDFNGNGIYGEAGEVGDGTYVGSVTSTSATVPASFLADDNDSPRTVKARIIDKDGGFTEYSVVIMIDNVAPVVDAGVDMMALAGTTFAHTITFTDPGSDSPWTVNVDWNGDGDFDDANEGAFLVFGHSFNIMHTYGVGEIGNVYDVRVRVDDGDGGIDEDTFEVTVVADTLRVIDFQVNHSGFDVTFNRAPNLDDLNLYDGLDDGNSLDPADVTLVRNGVQNIEGSIVWAADTNTLTFVRTGSVLAAGNYTVTLFSGATAFHDGPNLLDGDGDFDDSEVGDHYTANFVVNAPVVDTRIVYLPDFARGAGQDVNIPETGLGLPIRISTGTGVTAVDVDVLYDPNLLTITGAALGSGPTLAGGWSITTNSINIDATHTLFKITISGSNALSGANVELIRLDAEVPATAPYGDSQALRLTNLRVNEDLIASKADVAVHKAAYVGDADGDGSYGGTDAGLISRVVVGLDSGFDAHDWTDPRIVGDASGDGTLSGLDASYVAQEAVSIDVPEVPPIPPGMPLVFSASGVDPEYSIDTGIPATPGGTVTVPVNLNVLPAETVVGATFHVDYNDDLLTFDSATPGAFWSAGNGWNLVANPSQSDRVTVAMFNSMGETSSTGQGVIADLDFSVSDVALAGGTSTLDPEAANPNEGGLTWTDVDGSAVIDAQPGDYNHNGVVDAADYVIWRKNNGSFVANYTIADGDGDGEVEEDDYDLWTDNFGETFPGAAPTSSASADDPVAASGGESAPAQTADVSLASVSVEPASVYEPVASVEYVATAVAEPPAATFEDKASNVGEVSRTRGARDEALASLVEPAFSTSTGRVGSSRTAAVGSGDLEFTATANSLLLDLAIEADPDRDVEQHGSNGDDHDEDDFAAIDELFAELETANV